MIIFTYSQARQNLATVLDLARKEGEVWIRRKDGSLFCLKPGRMNRSPLDVRGIKTRVTTTDIISSIREMREN